MLQFLKNKKSKSFLPMIGFIDWPITKKQASNVEHAQHRVDEGFPFDPPMEYVIGGVWQRIWDKMRGMGTM
jgi:hypothetical protein